MSINLSVFDDSVVFVVNPAVHVSYFVVLCLPGFILIVLCVLALLFAKAVDTSIRITLLNIFAADMIFLLGISFHLLGFPARVHDEESTSFSCNFFVSTLFAGMLVKLPATALYSVVGYLHVKYGPKCGPRKMKWSVIVTSMIMMWIVSFSIGALPFTSLVDLVSNHGLCYPVGRSPVYIIIQITVPMPLATISIILTITFGFLTFCYVKRNTMPERDRAIPKAIIKLPIFLSLELFLTILYNLLPIIDTHAREALGDDHAIVALALYYSVNAFFAISMVLTPTATIILLKPVRETLRCACKLVARRCTDRPQRNETMVIPNLGMAASLVNPGPANSSEETVPDQDMESGLANDPDKITIDPQLVVNSRATATPILQEMDTAELKAATHSESVIDTETVEVIITPDILANTRFFDDLAEIAVKLAVNSGSTGHLCVADHNFSSPEVVAMPQASDNNPDEKFADTRLITRPMSPPEMEVVICPEHDVEATTKARCEASQTSPNSQVFTVIYNHHMTPQEPAVGSLLAVGPQPSLGFQPTVNPTTNVDEEPWMDPQPAITSQPPAAPQQPGQPAKASLQPTSCGRHNPTTTQYELSISSSPATCSSSPATSSRSPASHGAISIQL